jgi:hypothetical protein
VDAHRMWGLVGQLGHMGLVRAKRERLARLARGPIALLYSSLIF